MAADGVSRSNLGRIGRFVVQVVQQDITTLPDPVGAVVSSDDNYLSAGGGVSKAIARAAGDRVLSEMRTHVWGPLGRQSGGPSKLSAGQVIYTTAGDLRADYIFHAVVIDHDRYQYPDRALVSAVATECLQLADTLNIKSIALPLLGTGTGGMTSTIATESIADALIHQAGLGPHRSDNVRVIVAVVDSASFESAKRALSRFGTNGTPDLVLGAERDGGLLEPPALMPVLAAASAQDFQLRDFKEVDPPVVRLQRLLLQRLRASHEALARFLQTRGYVGSFEDQLLEYCLDTEPPALLVESLGGIELLTWAKELGLAEHELLGTSPRLLAERIVSRIGFPLPPKPYGISKLIHDTESTLKSLKSSPSQDLGAECTAIRRSFQTALLDLLRFHGTILLDPPFENALRERGWLTSTKSLNELAAGSLLGIVRKLADDLEGLSFIGMKSRALFGDPAFFADATAAQLEHSLGTLNKPIHEDPASRTRGEVVEAGEIVLRFLKQIGRTGLYPPVISVTSWTEDAYGRRTIRALDDSGSLHTIFTQNQLDPGHLYFMHPTTNPMRINPVLVRHS